MKVTQMPKLMKWLLPGVLAITLAPFGIFHREDKMPFQLLNHELIHWKQQTEMLIIFFFLWYGIEWCIKFLKWKSLAYYKLSFEKEAYSNEKNGKYLNQRKTFTWIKYL